MSRQGLTVGWRETVGVAILGGLVGTVVFGGVGVGDCVLVVVLLVLVVLPVVLSGFVVLGLGGPFIKTTPSTVTHTASTPLPTQSPSNMRSMDKYCIMMFEP